MKIRSLFFCLLTSFIVSCGKKDGAVQTDNSSLPQLSTTAISNLLSVSAQSGGVITSDGGAAITARGVCWSTSPQPVVSGAHTTDGTGTGSFTSTITALTAGTTYYARAYATNSKGTAYGNEVSFSTPAASDVHIVGWEDDPLRYWKNGSLVNLNLGTVATQATDIYVDDTGSVFMAGQQNTVIPYNKDRIWVYKNGTSYLWTTGQNRAVARCLFITGNDIYVGGSEMQGTKSVAKVWKNGVAVSITNGTLNAEVYAVYVNGADVYAAGNDGNTAMVWKNGVGTPLSTAGYTAAATSMAVDGSTVYAAGYSLVPGVSTSRAKLWINGADSTLISDTTSRAYDMVKAGGDLYITVKRLNTAYTWKNGVLLNMDNSGLEREPNALAVKGNDIYVVGWERSATYIKGLFWKNGQATALSTGNTNCYVYAVAVK